MVELFSTFMVALGAAIPLSFVASLFYSIMFRNIDNEHRQHQIDSWNRYTDNGTNIGKLFYTFLGEFLLSMAVFYTSNWIYVNKPFPTSLSQTNGAGQQVPAFIKGFFNINFNMTSVVILGLAGFGLFMMSFNLITLFIFYRGQADSNK